MDDRFSPDRACLLLEQEGMQAKISQPQNEGFWIDSGAWGIKFRLFFVGEDPSQFEMMTFLAKIENPGFEEDTAHLIVNTMNRDCSFARIYLDPEDIFSIGFQCPVPQDEMNDDMFIRFLACWYKDIKTISSVLG